MSLRVVLDIEANSLNSPTKIWCIVCKDINTNKIYIWRNLTDDEQEKNSFKTFVKEVTQWCGHNIIGYDIPVLAHLIDCNISVNNCIDTLILSKLINYSRPGGHSIEAYGEELGLEKIKFNDWTKYSLEMEEYCVRDVDICHRVYSKYANHISSYNLQTALATEQEFQFLGVNNLRKNGFYFNIPKAKKYLEKVVSELELLDKEILTAFPPREVLIREFTPKGTKYGTINKSSVPRLLREKICDYEIGTTYRHTRMDAFNPSSHKQIIDVLSEAGWSPTDRTKTHIELERTINRIKRSRNKELQLDTTLEECYSKLDKLKKYGWKVNENNLSSLPLSAPAPARTLAQRILYQARRQTLTEWLGLVDQDTSRIHGDFIGIGAWTHRMAHQRPNMANIPNSHDISGKVKLLGKEMRSLWSAPRNRLLIGVDAEGIQLRIFAHYIDDEEFTNSLINGKKEDRNDPHSLNQRILGDICKSRDASKRFIFALLLGAGLGMLGQILGVSENEAKSALARILERYQGFAYLKKNIIPIDAERGWFVGLDGRKVSIPDDTASGRRHLCMSGYLQNGEAIIMKMATNMWLKQLSAAMLVNMVHDEWQTECRNSLDVALHIAKTQSDSLRIVGEQLKLKCPLAGSYWNEKAKDYTIGTNWTVTH